MNGSLWLLYLGLFIFTLAAVGIGLSISALSLNMQQAMLYTFLLIMPMMLLSGLLTPVRNMPEVLQIADLCQSAAFWHEIWCAAFTSKAQGCSEVAFNFIPCWASRPSRCRWPPGCFATVLLEEDRCHAKIPRLHLATTFRACACVLRAGRRPGRLHGGARLLRPKSSGSG